jgi:hypothetical protein
MLGMGKKKKAAAKKKTDEIAELRDQVFLLAECVDGLISSTISLKGSVDAARSEIRQKRTVKVRIPKPTITFGK